MLNHLLYALLRLEQDAERDRLPLPMARLARHGLSRTQLRMASAARQQAIKAQLDDLLASWKASATLAGPLSVFRALESRHAGKLARRAARSGDSLAVLQAGQSRTGTGYRTAGVAGRSCVAPAGRHKSFKTQCFRRATIAATACMPQD